MKKYLLLSAATLFAGNAAMAAEGIVPQAPANATVVYLAETAVQNVQQDKIQATLEVQFEAASAETVQARINRAMSDTLAKAKQYKSIETNTGYYRVDRKWNAKIEQHDGWVGSQTIHLESADAADLLKLVTTLQDMDFNTQSLNYFLSNDKRRSMRDELLTNAIAKIQQRAEKVAKQLGKANVHLAEISLQDNEGARPPMMYRAEVAMMKANDAGMPAANVEGRNEEVSLTVNATVYLQQ